MQKWMKKILAFLPGLCLVAVPVDSKNCKLDVGAGYRQDKLVWELAGPDDEPKVLSRLTWENLRIFEIEAQFKKITDQNIYFRADADYGWIYEGANRDSDYRVAGSRSHVVEFSRSDNDAGKGQVYDASAALGYFLRWCYGSQSLRFAPLGGYSIHEQHLHLFNGYQSIDLDNPIFAGHHFKGLDSSYKARWHGPWVGMDLYYHINEQITLNGTFEYHWLYYHAKGDWNLRDDILGDFIHTGSGQGYFGTLGVDYNFCSGWYLGAKFKCNFAKVTNGKDKTVVGIPINAIPGSGSFEDEDSGLVIPFDTEGKLRNIKWTSFSFIFTAGYNF